ncbi:MAG: response regulator [Woeseiaceae bacterium]|nr:response regulator [Woeseiaceae bacterium]
MALKRALVVDDSKVARVTLKKQLERYNLQVELAESGEEALELLKIRSVDVIFMDHIMPGMDGLEAVSLIKSDARTATIPVMMYTSREGEVYVSEARALGAVGVLPKQVQPGVLFGMLEKLGLVRDRRAKTNGDSGEAHGDAVTGRPREDGDDKQVGIEISAVVSRILEDQHSELRSEILTTNKNFATQVANEVHNQLREDQQFGLIENELVRGSRRRWQFLSAALGIVLLITGVQFLQLRTERDYFAQDLADTRAALEQERLASISISEQLTATANTARSLVDEANSELLDTLIREMNESGEIPFDELPFNDARVDEIGWLVLRLSEAGFQGAVRIDSYLGEFCLVSDISGVYQLQEPDQPFTTCSFIGHPLDDSSLQGDRKTPSFEFFMAASPLFVDSDIELDIVIHDRSNSVPLVPYPLNPETVGDWNRVAAQNNRLEYSLVSAVQD